MLRHFSALFLLLSFFQVVMSQTLIVKVLTESGTVLGTGTVKALSPYASDVVTQTSVRQVPAGSTKLIVAVYDGDRQTDRHPVPLTDINARQGALASLYNDAANLYSFIIKNIMKSIYIVLPILTLLMFDLGLTLQPHDFMLIARRPRAVLVGLCGQLLLLPLIGYALATALSLPPYMFIGVMLIACCPGGSSSNIFSMLAKGDVALSVSLTALSSVITLVTLPLVMQIATTAAGASVGIHLPVGGLLLQNLVTMLVPIAAGILVRMRWEKTAERIDRILSKTAFPALMLLAGMFFIQHHDTIADNFSALGLCITMLILVSVAVAYSCGRAARLNMRERRTIVIEVGMQNAAQAIAVASSPLVFNNGAIAIPAIVYALMMNVILLCYVGVLRGTKERAKSF